MNTKIHYLSIKTDDNHNLPVIKVGSGQPVMLLHGFGMDPKAWLPFILPLCNKFCFYLPYLRGFAKSSHIGFTDDDFFKNYVDDIQNIRHQLNLHDLIIGGISMGAMTCMAMHAFNKFDGISKCMLIDQSPVIHNKDGWQWGLMGQNQTSFLQKLNNFYNSSQPYLDYSFEQLPRTVQTSMIQAVFTMVGASFNNKPMRLYSNFMRKYPNIALKFRDTDNWQNQRHIVGGYLTQDYDFRATAPNIDIPVHIIIGKQSRLYHPNGQNAYANMIPNAHTIEIDKAGHALLLDRPMAAYNAIKHFLLN